MNPDPAHVCPVCLKPVDVAGMCDFCHRRLQKMKKQPKLVCIHCWQTVAQADLLSHLETHPEIED